jgi:hypothetical protein
MQCYLQSGCPLVDKSGSCALLDDCPHYEPEKIEKENQIGTSDVKECTEKPNSSNAGTPS